MTRAGDALEVRIAAKSVETSYRSLSWSVDGVS